MLSATISGVYFLAGVLFGSMAPRWGLALLVGCVSVTSSLGWQLGTANLATPFLFTIGYLSGWYAHGRRPILGHGSDAREASDLGSIRTATYLFIGTVAVATVLGFIRNGVASEADASLASLIALFNPPGVAGSIQAALIAVSGPLLMLAAAAVIRHGGDHDAFPRWYLIGAALAVAAPAIQALALDPTVRPDLNSSFSIGFGGFFQDPHSYAAYLLLATCLSLGAAIAAWQRESRIPEATCATIAAAAVTVILFTGSRSGLLATAIGLATMLILSAYRIGAQRQQPWIPRAAVGAVVVMLFAGAVVLTVAPARRLAYGALSGLGSPLMWQPLVDHTDLSSLMEARLDLWTNGLDAVRARPLWGAGANGMNASLQARGELLHHLHNYYLQLAADYGIPALACFLALLGLIFARLLRGVCASYGPDMFPRAAVCGALAGMCAFLVASHPLLLAELQALFWTLIGWGLVTAQRSPGEEADRSFPTDPGARRAARIDSR